MFPRADLRAQKCFIAWSLVGPLLFSPQSLEHRIEAAEILTKTSLMS